MATMSLQAAYDQARSYLEANQVEQAIGVAQHILEHFPENLEAHRILGEAYLAGRQFDQAEAAFSRVLRADPENIPAHVGLGITFERQGKLDRAVAEFEQALEVRPDMPELRGQLLRLYTDLWGAEGATLRLSRPGLARLYAKGHMLPQAIQEFRSVIEEHPDRFDARVGLAEALWRDGQEDAAAETCETILADRADVLKANLLLGFIRLASSDETGEAYWRIAQQLDPYQQVARSLFETLPDPPSPDLTIPAWDETAWLERQAREAEQRHAQQQPALSAAAAATAASADEESFESWLDHADEEIAAAPVSGPTDAPAAENDDFLASLLALDTPPVPVDIGSDLDSSSGITPFSFDELDAGAPPAPPQPVDLADLDLPGADVPVVPVAAAGAGLIAAAMLSDEEPAPAEEEPQQPSPEQPWLAEPAPAEEELTPFSLADLGLSEDEIAQLGAGTPAAEPGLTPPGEEPALEPFSLADLGLSPEEVAQLNLAEPTSADEPALEPFSLADLGLSPDEIASLEVAQSPDALPATDEPALEPFSLADLGLSPDEIASLEVAQSPDALPAADEPALEPFSLADLGLSPDEIGAPGTTPPDAAPSLEADLAGLDPINWGEAEIDQATSTSDEIDAELADLQPFSLDDLDLNALGEDEDIGMLPPSLQPFSLDDAAIPPPPVQPPSLDAEEPTDSSGGYSWQQPSAKPQTDFLRAETSDAPQGSIFGRLKQRAAERPPEEPPPLPPVSDDDGEGGAYFSNDEVSLRDEEPRATEHFAGGFRLPKEGDSGAAGPGALAAGAAAGAIAAGAAAAMSSKDDQPPAEPSAAPDAAAAPDVGEPELTPFSLEDLGLSPDEIAQLEAAASAPDAGEPELTPFSLEDLGLSPDEIAQLEAAASAPDAAAAPDAGEPELTPFSLEDLGLSPDEIAQLEAAASAPDAAAAPDVGEPELTPFSLEDLGLSPDEIAQLEAASRGDQPFPATGETIVPGWSKGEEPELTPFSLEDIGATPVGGPPTADVQPFSIDEFNFDSGTGGAEAPTLEEGGIDESVGDVQPFSLDDFDFDTPTGSAGSSLVDESVGGDVQPFSLDDLGLDDLDAPDAASRELGLTAEELAGLDLGDFETLIGDPSKTTPLVSEDPEAALERLMTLGRKQGFVDLTDIISVVSDPEAEAERIEEMGWALHHAGIEIRDGDEVIDMEGEAEEEVAEETDAPSAPATMGETPAGTAPAFEGEPDLTPFSLSELGLSDEEIAALGLDEVVPAAPAPTPPAPAAEEPELTPFSLADLGLSPDEIAMLQLAEAEQPTPDVGEPSADVGAPVIEEEPELTPFSLEDLGLSPDEIAMLEGAAAAESAPTPPAASTEGPASSMGEPELTPFSLEDLGLSPDEIAMLEGAAAAAETSEGGPASDDLFDFGLAEEQPVEKVTRRTEPRAEEPPAPVDPADAIFIPEDLDRLDDIWDTPTTPATPAAPAAAAAAPSPATSSPPPARAESGAPARVVLPPLSERRREPPPPVSTSPRTSGGMSRDNERFARREAAQQGSGRRGWREAALWREGGEATPASAAASEFAGFLPTGDPMLDEYLKQLDGEPDNYGLALAIGHLCAETGRPAIMALAFKRIVRSGEGVDQLAEELEGLIGATGDPNIKQQLYKLLGDTYSKQGRYREAMIAYGTTFGR